MSESVVSLQNVSKIYRVYHHPVHQVTGLLNPKWVPQGAYTENKALVDFSLDIPKGSKIGIIGRNGSGKSTLLKLISGRIRPSGGEITVNGRISALLELGTGFHPEFTGRENIFSALAYMGITGNEARGKFDEIVDFSELETFIDQPVRVYSTGMYMRLAFAIATSVNPELLLVDEVLSVGDAYFTHKSLERMKELASDGQTTILFVSHNLYSLTFLCEQLVWLDGGVMRGYGTPNQILNLYDLSIGEEEERRLAIKNRHEKVSVSMSGTKAQDGGEKAAEKCIGSGHARVQEVWFENHAGQKQHLFKRGDAMSICVRYEIVRPEKCPQPVFIVAITRADGLAVACFIVRAYESARGDVLRVQIPQILLNQQSYFVSVLIYVDLDLDGHKSKFYTLDKNLCDAKQRHYEFKVEGNRRVESVAYYQPFHAVMDTKTRVELLNLL